MARALLNWAEETGCDIAWGEGIRDGSFVPVLRHGDESHTLFALFTYGKVEIYFQYYLRKEPFASVEKRHELRRKLNGISGVSIPADGIERRPSIETAVLAKAGNLQQFVEILNWIVAQIRAS